MMFLGNILNSILIILVTSFIKKNHFLSSHARNSEAYYLYKTYRICIVEDEYVRNKF